MMAEKEAEFDAVSLEDESGDRGMLVYAAWKELAQMGWRPDDIADPAIQLEFDRST